MTRLPLSIMWIRLLVVATLVVSCLNMVAAAATGNVHRIAEISAWAALMLAMWVWTDEP